MLSYPENIPTILSAIVEANPKKILDVGSGYGKYGVLAREAIYSHRAERGDLQPEDDVQIDCCEVAKYFWDLAFHQGIYNSHLHGDIFAITPSELAYYDLILLIDVCEHWTDAEWKEFVGNMTTQKVLVSTPKQIEFYEPEYYGKDCPKHKKQFSEDDFNDFKTRIDYSNERSFIKILQK